MTNTQQEYLTNPINCPFCNSPHINDIGKESCIEDGTFIIDIQVDCEDCKKMWNDRYKLFAYEEVTL